MEKEKITSGSIIDWKVLKRLFSFIGTYRIPFYTVILLTLLIGFLTPVRAKLIQFTLDEHVAPGYVSSLIKMLSLLLGLLIIQFGLQYIHTFMSGWIGQQVIHSIRIKLYRHLLWFRLSFFDRTPIGRLVTRTISDVETLSSVFTEGLAAMSADLLQIVFILAFMFYENWKLALVSLSTLPFMFLATYVFKEKIKISFNDVRNAVSNLNSFVQEHITGMSVVQLFGSENIEYKKFKQINKEHRNANLRSVLYYSIYFPVAELIAAMGIGLLMWYGTRGIINYHEAGITVGMLTAFIMYIQMFFRPIRMIADRFNTLQLGIISSARIINLLDDHSHLVEEGNHSPELIRGEVQFDRVWFAYQNDEYVLRNISLDVSPGEVIALVGATGAGKSSIINLLNRFYEVSQGKIIIDGVNIQDYTTHSLRQHIGIVLQDVFLFSGSIRYNISLGNPNVTDQMIHEAIERVGASKFINQLPGGLDYNVMERGMTLSVGQRQLLSFVRVMVHNPSILILDEATASVDSETEELIQQAIVNLMSGRTSFVVAHRLSTIQKADKIIVLDHGEIKEVGTHADLLKRGGLYTQLHKMQYKGGTLPVAS